VLSLAVQIKLALLCGKGWAELEFGAEELLRATEELLNILDEESTAELAYLWRTSSSVGNTSAGLSAQDKRIRANPKDAQTVLAKLFFIFKSP